MTENTPKPYFFAHVTADDEVLMTTARIDVTSSQWAYLELIDAAIDVHGDTENKTIDEIEITTEDIRLSYEKVANGETIQCIWVGAGSFPVDVHPSNDSLLAMQASTFDDVGKVYLDHEGSKIFKIDGFSFDPRNLDEMVTYHETSNPMVKFTTRRDWFNKKYAN